MAQCCEASNKDNKPYESWCLNQKIKNIDGVDYCIFHAPNKDEWGDESNFINAVKHRVATGRSIKGTVFTEKVILDYKNTNKKNNSITINSAEYCTFKNEVLFVDRHIANHFFDNAIFENSVIFENCQIDSRAFLNAKYEGGDDSKVSFNKCEMTISGVGLSKEREIDTFMDFKDLSLSADSNIADFVDVCFEKGVDFSGHTFKKDVKFTKRNLKGVAKFESVVFEKKANFISVELEQGSSFKSADFYDVVNFNNVNYESYVSFKNTRFREYGLFNSYSEEESGAGNKKNNFRDGADFRNVLIDYGVKFKNIYAGKIKFLGSDVDKMDFINCRNINSHEDIFYDEKVYRSDVKNGRLNDDNDKVGRLRNLQTLYRKAKEKHMSGQNWGVVSDYHYDEKRIKGEKLRYKGEHGAEFWNKCYKLFSGYNERPLYAFIWLVVIMLFYGFIQFAGFYWDNIAGIVQCNDRLFLSGSMPVGEFLANSITLIPLLKGNVDLGGIELFSRSLAQIVVVIMLGLFGMSVRNKLRR